MRYEQSSSGRARESARRQPLDHPVYLSLFAGVGLATLILAIMFSWVAAAVGGLIFLAAAARWTWTMRDEFAFLLADADPPQDADTRPDR